jgi:cytidylate kinase
LNWHSWNFIGNRDGWQAMIVTIDGPAGAGKSTIARRLAARLGFRFLDTGAMYRAVAWYLQDRGIAPDSEAVVGQALGGLDILVDHDRVFVSGTDVTTEIRTPEVSELASVIAVMPVVRAFLVEQQREIGRGGNLVTEGRDQGTVVFPEAPCKFFLTASPEVRARRRWEEIRDRQPGLSLEQVIADQLTRDRRDASRAAGRLERAADAVEILTDDKTLDDVVDEMEAVVRSRSGGAVGPGRPAAPDGDAWTR